MNTTNILLGTTSLLLVVAFAISFGGFNGNKDSDESRLKREQLEAEIAKIEAEKAALRLEHIRSSTAYVPAADIPPVPDLGPAQPDVSEDAARIQRELDEEKQRREALENKTSDLEEKLKNSEKETELANAEKTKIKREQEERAKRVRMALLMGTVTIANKETALVIFEPSESANFQPGKILNVRRNDGIIGQIEVDRLDGNLYVCTMRPNGYAPDGYPDILPGDEVIIDHGDQISE